VKVEILDYMGSDLSVVNAARVSFDKESDWLEVRTCELHPQDTKLIYYLANHGHWTPFSHCFATFRIKAPIFVARQLFKHKVGLTENEVSRRYVDSEPEFYEPDKWRKRADNKKQGSSEEAIELGDGAFDRLTYTLSEMNNLYRHLLFVGVCPEQARMVLPQSMYTEWIWSGSIAAFARVYNQRTSEHSQRETRVIAEAIGEALEPLFPVSWNALTADSQESLPSIPVNGEYYGA